MTLKQVVTKSVTRTFDPHQPHIFFTFPQGLEVTVEPFPTMSHGFLTRGNMEDPDVAAEVPKYHKISQIVFQVARAMNITVEFLNNQFGK